MTPDLLLIAGSQTLTPSVDYLDSLITTKPTRVICGCAHGVDRAGWAWARKHDIPCEYWPAWPEQLKWARSVAWVDEDIHALPLRQGREAGVLRNGSMAKIATRALLLRDKSHGPTPGTTNMRDFCVKEGVPFTLLDV